MQEALQFPSLNIRGMSSGYQDRTIIPPDATAALDLRLVEETPSASLAKLVRAHIEMQGYHLVTDEPTNAERAAFPKLARLRQSEAASEAFPTEPESPAAAAVTESLGRIWGAPPVLIRTIGGMVPIAAFIRELNVPFVLVPS